MFKHRPGVRLAKVTEDVDDVFGVSTVQRLDVHVQNNGLLLLLPDPVTCFSAASYNQIQAFRLEQDASIVLLDWTTSGRMSRGEQWQFSRYYSVNEVWLDKKRIVRDVLLLEDADAGGVRPLKERMGVYSCYATLILCGPKLRGITQMLAAVYREISIYQRTSTPDLLWSMSQVEYGCVVRIAGAKTEGVRSWIREHLNGLVDCVGADVLGKALI